MRTREGYLALESYNEWMKAQGKRQQTPEIFMKSMYFLSFERFANFLKEAEITSYRGFIGLMVTNGVDPKFWTDHRAYAMFIEYHDRIIPVDEQIRITINAMLDVTEQRDVPINKFYDVVEDSELISLIQRRKLTPWILLRSMKFKNKLRYMSEEQRLIIAKMLRIPLWKIRFDNNPQVVDDVNQLIFELEI